MGIEGIVFCVGVECKKMVVDTREPDEPRACALKLENSDEVCLVDEEYAAFLRRWRWHWSKGYAVRCEWSLDRKKVIQYSVHKVVMALRGFAGGHGLVVNHINGNGLDCRKANLEMVSTWQNCLWGRRSKPVVQNDNGQWHAHIQVNNQRVDIGDFDKEEDAQRAYNAVAAWCPVFESRSDEALITVPRLFPGFGMPVFPDPKVVAEVYDKLNNRLNGVTVERHITVQYAYDKPGNPRVGKKKRKSKKRGREEQGEAEEGGDEDKDNEGAGEPPTKKTKTTSYVVRVFNGQLKSAKFATLEEARAWRDANAQTAPTQLDPYIQQMAGYHILKPESESIPIEERLRDDGVEVECMG